MTDIVVGVYVNTHSHYTVHNNYCEVVSRGFICGASQQIKCWYFYLLVLCCDHFLGANIFVSQISLFLTFVSPYVDAETMIDTFSLINLETVAKNSWK